MRASKYLDTRGSRKKRRIFNFHFDHLFQLPFVMIFLIICLRTIVIFDVEFVNNSLFAVYDFKALLFLVLRIYKFSHEWR